MLFEAFAHDVAEQAPNATDMTRVYRKEIEHLNVRLVVRVSGHNEGPWERERFVPTGGLYLEAEIINPGEHYSKRGISRSSRLGPGWTELQLANRLKSLTKQVREIVPTDLVTKRNEVYARFDAHTLTEAEITAIDEAERDASHTTDYQSMTLDDCAFWLQWADEHGIA